MISYFLRASICPKVSFLKSKEEWTGLKYICVLLQNRIPYISGVLPAIIANVPSMPRVCICGSENLGGMPMMLFPLQSEFL